MKENRAPNTIWCLRRDLKFPWVRTGANDQIVVIFNGFDVPRGHLYLSRKDARLLARRINQCLDETVKGKRS